MRMGEDQREGARTCVKTPEEIVRMRKAGKVARTVLDHVLRAVKPGSPPMNWTVLRMLNALNLALPQPFELPRFPKSLCTSVNEVVCHGIPDDRLLVEGDIINCDVTVFIDGMHDCSETVFVGKSDPEIID